MNTNKILVSILAITAILFTSSVSAMGPRNGAWNANAWTNFVDTNNNGIADGQEDWDNDGVLNKDDEDYQKAYVNMRDDDGDGIPNKDDEDYVKPQDGTGNQNRNMRNGSNSGAMNRAWVMNGSGAMNGQGNMNRVQSKYTKYVDNAKKARYKNIIQSKYQSKIDSLSTDKLELLLTRIDDLEAKIEASTTYTEDKKESIITILEALKDVVIEKLETEDVNIDDLLE